MMQRLDHEFMLRSSECPLLKRKPSEYIQGMYYTTQPMEMQNLKALECTFEMIKAETQLSVRVRLPALGFRPSERDL